MVAGRTKARNRIQFKNNNNNTGRDNWNIIIQENRKYFSNISTLSRSNNIVYFNFHTFQAIESGS